MNTKETETQPSHSATSGRVLRHVRSLNIMTPRRQGIFAARDGIHYGENPYSEHSEDHWQWLAGWTAYKESIGAKWM